MSISSNKIKIDIPSLNHSIRQIVPQAVLTVAERLDYELYAVGGIIRNLILKRGSNDIDLAVVGDAPGLAREIAKELELNEIAIYARFGTALLRIGDRNFEFATARAESYLPDSRKPVEIQPVAIDEDLKRRDFTINTLAFGLTGSRTDTLIDLFGGVSDLGQETIRTPQDPGITFSDDPLRMLRAVRFAADLGFTIDHKTWDGIRENVHRIDIVAAERVGDELWKMLSGPDPVEAMRMLITAGLMDRLIPEIIAMGGVEQVGRHKHKDVLLHSLKVMQNVVDVTNDPVIRLAGLLHDIGKPSTKRFDPEQGWTFHGHEYVGARMVVQICRRLKIGKDVTHRLTNLIRLHMRPVNLTSEGVSDSAIRRLMVETAEDVESQLTLCRADITTANPRLVDKYLANFEEMEARMGDVEARDRMRKFQSPVRGDEIIELCGVEPGPLVGALKERVEDAILDGIIPYEYNSAKQFLLQIRDEVVAMDSETINRERRERSRDRRNIDRQFKFPDE